ncbi:MAG: hypothetical protein FWC09_06800 [Lachnospiraceae bacterium]|nr:hypothetical protein [Lachnospiraceae bacterium]
MKKQFLSILLILVVVLSLNIVAFADYTGVKWPSTSITYSYTSAIASTESAAYSTAASRWTSSTKVNLNFTGINSSANIVCDAVTNSLVDWDGFASWNYTGSNITKSYLYLNKHYTTGYSADKRLSVASHEFGHAIGLADKASNVVAVMNGYSNSRWDIYRINAPTGNEQTLINNLY